MSLNTLNHNNIPDVFVTPHEYVMVSPRLAKVTASVSAQSECNQADLLEYISASLTDGLTPIRSSFRWLDKDHTSIVGFVYSPTRIEHCPGGKVAANFRVTAGNLYMDEKDKSLWEMKEGAGGKYLMRKGQDDLTAMLETCRTSPRGSQPRLSQVLNASVEQNEFVAYISEGRRTSEVDYGVVLGAAVNGGIVVLSHLTSEPVAVPKSHVVTAYQLDLKAAPKLPKEKVEAMLKGKLAQASRVEKAADAYTPKLSPQEYWTLQYSYAPAYLEEVLKQVNEMAAA